MKNSFRYFKEKNIRKIILGLLVLINLAIIIIGFIVLYTSGSDDSSITETIWNSVKILFDPPSILSLRLSALLRVITGLLILIGMITFTGGTVGYVTNLITDSIANSRAGNSKVLIRGGTLILNWSESAMNVVLDRVSDKKRNMKDDKEYIVVLANEDKVSLENEIKKRIHIYREYTAGEFNERNPRIIVRNGNPESAYDLENVSWECASSILIFRPRNSMNPDYHVMKSYLCLGESIAHLKEDRSIPSQPEVELPGVPVVVEIGDAQVGSAIECKELGSDGVYEYNTQIVAADIHLGRVYGQIALMPELYGAIKSMMGSSGSRITWCEGVCKNSIEDDIRELKYSLPLFDVTRDGEEKKRVYLTSEDAEGLGSNTSFVREERVNGTGNHLYKYSTEYEFDTHRIIIVGINTKLRYILDCFVAYNKAHTSNPVSVVLVVTKDQKEWADKFINFEDYKELFETEAIVIADYYSVDEFEDYIDLDLHSIIVLSLENKDDAERDQNVFEAWLALKQWAELSDDEQDLEIINGRIILEILDGKNAQLIEEAYGRTVVVSSDFISLFMGQMSDGNLVYYIMMDLLSNRYDEEIFLLDGIDTHDLAAIPANALFGTDEDRNYDNKRDFIGSVYVGTKKRVLPIGMVRNGTTYLFSNGCKVDCKSFELDHAPSLSDSILIDDDESLADDNNPSKLVIKNDDYIVVVVRDK